MIPPIEVLSPRNLIDRIIRIVYNGTLEGGLRFSIAEILLQNGNIVFGIRHDINNLNENNSELGYPTVRGGHPSWFILPNFRGFAAKTK